MYLISWLQNLLKPVKARLLISSPITDKSGNIIQETVATVRLLKSTAAPPLRHISKVLCTASLSKTTENQILLYI